MNKKQAIQQKIADLKTAISTNLFLGAETQALRDNLAELEGQLREIERREANEERSHLAAEAEKQALLTDEATSEVLREVTAAAGSDEVAGVQMPEVAIDPAIAQAVSRLTYARERLAREESVYREHSNKHSVLADRLSEKERSRDAILSRRITGDEKPGDAAEIALLAADISSLKELVADAHRNAEQYRPTTALRLVADAEKALDTAKKSAVFNAKQARVLALEQAFIQAHAELVAAGAAIGERNPFTIFRASNETRRIVFGTN